jgi:hypothetical protein
MKYLRRDTPLELLMSELRRAYEAEFGLTPPMFIKLCMVGWPEISKTYRP